MEPSQPENLWLKLLNQSSKRVLVPESACVVAGEADSGKAALLSRLAQQPSLQVAASSLELIHYNFIDVEDSSLAMPTKVHLWQLDERLLPCAKDLLSSTMSQHMYIIALDLTTGDQAVETLKKWLALITPLVHHAYANFPAEKQESMRSKYLQYMLKARLTKGSAVEAVPEEHHEELTGIARFEFAAKHFALPIVVVGCKMELLDMTNSLTAKTVREIRGKLRALCLEAGAALVFTSTIEESEEMQQLRRYILHRLYPESISMSLQIEDRLQSTFVPSGFDTIDLIELSAGCKVEKEGLRNYFSTDSPDLTMKENRSKQLERPPVSFATIEPEQDWLQVMQSHIAKFAAESGVTKSSNAILDAIQAEADASSAASERRRPDPIITSSTSSGKESGAAGASAATGAAPTAPPTKRASIIRTVNTTDKKDVGDFFKNLMETKPKK